MSESLVNAVDRLLDCLERDHPDTVMLSPALKEAVDLLYFAYLRERNDRGEYASDFPLLSLRVTP